MGPGTPGIDLKSPKKFRKFGPEVSTIFEILIFGFLGVFLMEIIFFPIFPYFLPWGGPGPPRGGALGPPGGASSNHENINKIKVDDIKMSMNY